MIRAVTTAGHAAVSAGPPTALSAADHHAPWPRVEVAVAAVGGCLGPGACAAKRSMTGSGLPAPLSAALVDDLATVVWTLDLGPAPVVADRWVVPLAAAQVELDLSGFAVSGTRLLWLARQDAAAGADALSAGLPLVLADAGHAWRLARRLAARGRAPRRALPPTPPPALPAAGVVAAAEAAVAADLGAYAAAGWLVAGGAGAWRLAQPPGGTLDGPPGFEVHLDHHTLRVAAAIQVDGADDAVGTDAGCVPGALGRFVLAHNARQPARLRPAADGAPPAVWVEHAAPLAGAGRGALANGLAAVAATYAAVCREVAALGDPAIAGLLDLCDSRRSILAGSPHRDAEWR